MRITIEDYIEQNRISKYLPDDYSEKLLCYMNTYNRIKDTVKINYDYPELFCCYTLNKTCEIVTLNEEKSYLIYDMALGQYMSYLNTFINMEDLTQDHLEWFYSRCRAEIFCSMGQFEAAILAKMMTDTIKECCPGDISKCNNTLPVVNAMSYVQECFVMLHEISHYRLSKISHEEYKQQIQSMRAWIHKEDLEILDRRSTEINKEFWENGASDIDKDIYNYSSFKSDFDNHIILEHDYYSKDSNIEEIICDRYALSILINYMESFLPFINEIYGYELDKREYYFLVCYACQVALENLAILEMIDNSCASVISNGYEIEMFKAKKLNDPFSSSLSRKRCLIHSMIQLLDLKDSTFSDGLPMLTNCFDDTCLILWEHLFNPSISKKVKEEYNIKVNAFEICNDNNVILILKGECLARVRGW